MGKLNFVDEQNQVVFAESRQWQIASDVDTCVAIGSGTWSTTTNWSGCTTGGAHYPGQLATGDIVSIPDGKNMSLDVNPAKSVGNITVTTASGNGASLSFGASKILTSTGTLTVSITAGAGGAASFNVGSGQFNGAIVNVTGVSGGGTTSMGVSTGGTITLTGALTVAANGAGVTSLTVGAGTFNGTSATIGGTGNGGDSITLGAGGNISLTGNLTIGNTGNVSHALSASGGTITVAGNIVFQNTAANAQLTFSGSPTLNVGGNMGTGGTFVQSTSTVNFYSGSATSTVANYTYYNFTATPGKTLTFANSTTTTISHALTLNGQSCESPIILK